MPLATGQHRIAFAALTILAVLRAASSAAGDAPDARPLAGAPLAASDACAFFRGQAYGRGLNDFATEMLWACEAIRTRRSAGVELSEHLYAVELALERYRAAVVEEASGAGHLSTSMRYAVGEGAKVRIAEETGTMAALEAIRSGF